MHLHWPFGKQQGISIQSTSDWQVVVIEYYDSHKYFFPGDLTFRALVTLTELLPQGNVVKKINDKKRLVRPNQKDTLEKFIKFFEVIWLCSIFYA